MTDPPRQPRMRAFTTRVVGVTFCDGYPESMGQLDLLARRRLIVGDGEMEPIPAVLIRNPENAHDPNAVEVHVPAIGHQIGHVAAHTARFLAPLMDDGIIYRAWVTEVLTREDRPDKPGINLRVERVDAPASGPDGPRGDDLAP